MLRAIWAGFASAHAAARREPGEHRDHAADHSASRTPGSEIVHEPTSTSPSTHTSDNVPNAVAMNGPTVSEIKQAEAHDRVQRCERPAAHLVGDVLLQHGEAGDVRGPGRRTDAPR